MLNHLPTLTNYKKLSKVYKNALSVWAKETCADYMVEIIEYYYPSCTPEEKVRLRNKFHRFINGSTFKLAYIEPYAFLLKAMKFYTLKTGKLKPDNWPELEDTPKY